MCNGSRPASELHTASVDELSPSRRRSLTARVADPRVRRALVYTLVRITEESKKLRSIIYRVEVIYVDELISPLYTRRENKIKIRFIRP